MIQLTTRARRLAFSARNAAMPGAAPRQPLCGLRVHAIDSRATRARKEDHGQPRATGTGVSFDPGRDRAMPVQGRGCRSRQVLSVGADLRELRPGGPPSIALFCRPYRRLGMFRPSAPIAETANGPNRPNLAATGLSYGVFGTRQDGGDMTPSRQGWDRPLATPPGPGDSCTTPHHVVVRVRSPGPLFTRAEG